MLEEQMTTELLTPGEQIDKLAKFIMAEVPGEPSQSEGAIDTAIRIIRRRQGWMSHEEVLKVIKTTQLGCNDASILAIKTAIEETRKQTLKEYYQHLIDKRLLCATCGTIVLEPAEVNYLRNGNLPEKE